ncbi:PKD domain-containing protein [Halomicrobium zhouii]|uniref:PKD domain-containing protein n=1 Tax=Halomicrobium zhouii TaxID=767519 RepID=A0A1I6KP72_9EURY|nr:PKD domain-containing protein [Halomicrobium zhouii]SFR93042.1 PKD domain-containing protein [Halomicrobium zhouii]
MPSDRTRFDRGTERAASETRASGGRGESRRSFLQLLGTGLVAAAGAGASGSVAAQSSGPEVTTLDLRVTDDPSLPAVDELFVFAHGWNSASSGPDLTATVVDGLAAAGYEPDAAVALVYQADASGPSGAIDQSAAAAAEFAPVVEDAIDAGAGSVRLAAHSLGGRVVLGTLSELGPGYVVDTVAPMGAAANGSTVTEGGQWYDGVAENAREVRNYHSRNDQVIGDGFGSGGTNGNPGDTALGAEGVPNPSAAPDTYTDVDVTDSVSGHGGYMSSPAVTGDLAEAIIQDDGEDTPTDTPDTETPDTETPDTETPDIETPDTETPDTETPPSGDLIASIDPGTTSAGTGELVQFWITDETGGSSWITDLQWELGDGTSASGWYADNRYGSAGTYTVTLTATDSAGNTSTDEVTVQIS